MNSQPYILGIDGGGTKTVAWLAKQADASERAVIGRGQAGPGNPRAAGFPIAQQNIALAIERAFEDAHMPLDTVAAACFGLAGAGRPHEQQRISDWAYEQQIAVRVQVTGDAEPILAAASPEAVGVALIAGTGSFAWGRDAAGQTARSGGWGYLIGDEGSGYAIALAALRAAARSADQRGPETALLPALLQKLQITAPHDLVSSVYAPEMTRQRLAQLATIVFDLQATDKVAADIIHSAAADLAQMVTSVATQLRLPFTGYFLAATGGIVLNQPAYFELVVQELETKQDVPPRRSVVVRDPVAGAVAIARRLVQS